MKTKHKHKQLFSLKCKVCRRTLVRRMERHVCDYADALHSAVFGGGHSIRLQLVKHRS